MKRKFCIVCGKEIQSNQNTCSKACKDKLKKMEIPNSYGYYQIQAYKRRMKEWEEIDVRNREDSKNGT